MDTEDFMIRLLALAALVFFTACGRPPTVTKTSEGVSPGNDDFFSDPGPSEDPAKVLAKELPNLNENKMPVESHPLIPNWADALTDLLKQDGDAKVTCKVEIRVCNDRPSLAGKVFNDEIKVDSASAIERPAAACFEFGRDYAVKECGGENSLTVATVTAFQGSRELVQRTVVTDTETLCEAQIKRCPAFKGLEETWRYISKNTAQKQARTDLNYCYSRAKALARACLTKAANSLVVVSHRKLAPQKKGINGR